jgi:hypothetical protein
MFQFNKHIFSYDIGLIDGELFFLSKDRKIERLNGIFFDQQIDGDGFYISRFGGCYWLDDHNGQAYALDEITNTIVFQNQKENFKVTVGREPVSIDNNHMLVSRRIGREKIKSTLNVRNFTFSDVVYRGNYGFPGFHLVVDKIFDEDRRVDYLVGYSTQTGMQIWRYDCFREYQARLSGEIKTESVRSILALVGEILWVLLDTGRIVGLDPMTGECKKSIEIDHVDLTHFENAETDFINARGIGSAYVSGEEKVIYLSSNIYFEIDLTAEKPTRVCYNVKQTFKDSDVTGGGHQCVNDRYVFFNESMIGTIGAFDRQTKKVVWVDKLKNHKPDAGAVRELKATESQLYVHDNKQNLFVFDLT